MQQIAPQIAGASVELESTTAADATLPTTSARHPAPLRILQIRLQPAELGIVTATIRLGGDGLELRLEASNPETADLLRRDRRELSDLLRGAGYSVDAVRVEIVESRAATAQPLPPQGQGQSHQQPPQSGFEAQSGRSGEGNQAGREHVSRSAASEDTRENPETGHEDTHADARGGIYL